jgi:hypothetical protein
LVEAEISIVSLQVLNWVGVIGIRHVYICRVRQLKCVYNRSVGDCNGEEYGLYHQVALALLLAPLDMSVEVLLKEAHDHH